MFRQGLQFEWQIGVSEETPLILRGRPGMDTPPRRLSRTRLLLFLLLFVAGALAWRSADQRQRQRIQADIAQTAQLEARAWASEDEHLSQFVLDQQAPQRWADSFRIANDWQHIFLADRFEMQEVGDVQLQAVNGDRARVVVTVEAPSLPWLPAPYQEGRFYRWNGSRWVRTAPTSHFWGPLRRLESEYFRIEYHDWDAEAVKQVAPDLDVAYRSMRALLDLPPPTEKLSLAIVPEMTSSRRERAANNLVLISPQLTPIPAGLDKRAYLAYRAQRLLAEQVVNDALPRRWVQNQWMPLVRGLHLWLIFNSSELAATWQPRMEASLRRYLAERRLPQLNDLSGDGPSLLLWPEQWSRDIVGKSLIDYIEENYGRDGVRALLAGFGEHTTRNRLFPALYGASATQFETGWQAHLRATYST